MGTIVTEIVDDKSQFCIPFILGHLEAHRRRNANLENAPPFFLGLNGVQGAGKTVLVRHELTRSPQVFKIVFTPIY
jgi:pantothenate kinase-related protein Tda10